MRKRITGLLAVTLAGVLFLVGCGSSTNTTSAPEQETATTASGTAEETASTEDTGVEAETSSEEGGDRGRFSVSFPVSLSPRSESQIIPDQDYLNPARMPWRQGTVLCLQ